MTRFGVSLEDYRAAEIVRLDAAAEAFRQKFITAGAGQAMAYDAKLQEATAFLSPAGAELDDVPHLVAEAAAEGMTVTEKAQQIATVAHAWRQLSARIEARRATAKAALRAAETAAEIRLAGVVDWDQLVQ